MTLLRTYDPSNQADVSYIHGVIEEFIQISGFQITVHMLSNRTVDNSIGGNTPDEYSVGAPTEDPNQADPIFAEMRKRNYLAARTIWCLPDALERNNFLEKFGLVSQDTMNLHFPLFAMERDLSRKLAPGDLIQLPSSIESRFYEVTDVARSDYELYASYLWKVECKPAMTSQDVAPIPVADLSYGSEILSNTQVEDDSTVIAPNSGIDYLDQVN